MSYGELN